MTCWFFGLVPFFDAYDDQQGWGWVPDCDVEATPVVPQLPATDHLDFDVDMAVDSIFAAAAVGNPAPMAVAPAGLRVSTAADQGSQTVDFFDIGDPSESCIAEATQLLVISALESVEAALASEAAMVSYQNAALALAMLAENMCDDPLRYPLLGLVPAGDLACMWLAIEDGTKYRIIHEC